MLEQPARFRARIASKETTMRNVLAVIAIAGSAILASSSSSSAFVGSGFDFYRKCGTGFEAGFAHREFCHAYLQGFYDALGAERRVCSPGAGPVVDTQVVMVVQSWLRAHANNMGNVPADVMIRNALVSAWPCG
jgi:hypothetical protein